jgi:CubicO group peptidase (beta-lactamase class C family)
MYPEGSLASIAALSTPHTSDPVDPELTTALLASLHSRMRRNVGRAVWLAAETKDPATYRLMTARFNRIFYPMRYGLGVMRFPVPRFMSPTRRPLTLLGHSGSTGSWLFHCPELDVVLAGTVNQARRHQTPFRLMPRLIAAVHGALR